MEFKSLDFSNPEPYYMQIAKIIEQKIVNKEIKIGKQLPVEDGLCKVFNVCDYTIRKALTELTREGYIARRRNHGTFVMSSEPKKSLILEVKNEISLVVCPPVKTDPKRDTLTHPHFYRIIKGIEERAREKNLYLVYSTINESQLSLVGKKKDIAGLIVTGGISPKYFRIIKKLGIPLVIIGDIAQKTMTKENVDVIVNDDFQSIYLAAKHLIDLGHKRIVYIVSSLRDNYWEIEYLKGYHQAHKEANISCDNKLQIGTGRYSVEDGYNAIKKLLDSSVSFTGIICEGEVLLDGAMKAIIEKGMRIPEDISVICHGVSHYLTIVTHDDEEMGRMAVERLIDRIVNPDWQPKRIIIPDKLIIRDSTRRIKN